MSSIKTPLKKGDAGTDVGRLQTLLIKQKFLDEKLPNGKPSLDADFGAATETAVKLFQSKVGLPETGVVDSDTLQQLNPYRTAVVSAQVSTDFQLKMPANGRFTMTPRLVPQLTLAPYGSAAPAPTHAPQPPPPAAEPVAPAAKKEPTGKGLVYQPQIGPQYVLKPPRYLYSTPAHSSKPPPSLAYQVQFWFTYRTAKDGLHLEVGAGPSFSYNQKFHSDDPRYTISGALSIMVADIFAPGSFHLLSPNLQLGIYNNFDKSFSYSSSGLSINIGNQMSYEIINDRLMIMVTPGFWMQYDFKSKQIQGAPGMSFAIGGSF